MSAELETLGVQHSYLSFTNPPGDSNAHLGSTTKNQCLDLTFISFKFHNNLVRQTKLGWHPFLQMVKLRSKITADGDCSHEIKRHLLLGRRVMTNLDRTLKSRDITLPTKVHLVKAMIFPVVMYGCESWTIKKAERRRIDAFELLCKTLENPLDCKEIQPVHPKRNQSWIFIGKTDAEAETPILWPLDAKSWFIGKDPDAGKDWRWEEKGRQRMRRLDGITDSMDMSLNLVCCSPWGHKESDTTEWLNWTESLQLCPTLCNSLHHSLPDSSVHGIFQARILEWVAISFCKIPTWYLKITCSKPNSWISLLSCWDWVSHKM